MVNKKAEIIRVYLPPDANCLLSVADHCLRSRHYVNVIVAGKQPALDYLTMDEAIAHCTRGLGIWTGRATTTARSPTSCSACAGDIPTLEALAAAALLREHLPELKVRFVNVVDLMRLQDETEHPHGLSDAQFDALFTADRPVIFAYHGYPWLIHRLTYRRTNHRNLHVRGYKEEGTTTTPFDMVMLNDMDRFHLVMDVIDRVPGLGQRAARLRQEMVDERLRARAYTREHGDDPPERARLEAARALGVRVLVVNAGSSSLKLRLVGADDELLGARDLEPGDDVEAAARGASATADAVGHRVVHGGARFVDPVRDRRRRRRRAGGARPRSRRCTSRRRSPRSPRCAARAAAAAGGRLLRHGVPRRAARRGGDLRAAARLARALAAAPLRLPRALARLGGAARGRAARRARERIVTCHLGAARRWPPCRDGRSVDTTMGFTPLEGLVMATRSGDVDPGPAAVAARADGPEPARGRRRRSSTRRACRGSRAPPTCARCSPRRRAATPTPSWRSTSTCTACARRSPRWRRRSAASTRSCSPAASASARPRCARARPPASAFLGVALDAAANAAADAATPTIGAPGAPVRTLVVARRARTSRSRARSAPALA